MNYSQFLLIVILRQTWKIYKSLNIGIYVPENRACGICGIMLKKESEILYWLAKEPWKKYNFTELQRISKKKSRSYLASVLNRQVKDRILKKESFAHLQVYSLSHDSAKARIFAGFVLECYAWNKKHIPYGDLQRMMDKIPYDDYILLITGSYAKEKQTETSDIDVVILIGNCAEPKKVYAELSYYCEMNIPPIHLYVFRHKEFIEMLCNKEANYGKEMAKNNLILAGGQVYFKLIHEAMQNGYNG